MNGSSNGHFRTSIFREAAFYIARGVRFIRVDPPAIDQQNSTFVLAKLPEDLQSDWQSHRDSVSARALFDAQDLLRDALKGKI